MVLSAKHFGVSLKKTRTSRVEFTRMKPRGRSPRRDLPLRPTLPRRLMELKEKAGELGSRRHRSLRERSRSPKKRGTYKRDHAYGIKRKGGTRSRRVGGLSSPSSSSDSF